MCCEQHNRYRWSNLCLSWAYDGSIPQVSVIQSTEGIKNSTETFLKTAHQVGLFGFPLWILHHHSPVLHWQFTEGVPTHEIWPFTSVGFPSMHLTNFRFCAYYIHLHEYLCVAWMWIYMFSCRWVYMHVWRHTVDIRCHFHLLFLDLRRQNPDDPRAGHFQWV